MSIRSRLRRIAVVVTAGSVLTVPSGASAGLHAATTAYPVGNGGDPRQIAIGDFDGDGRPDLVVADVETGGGDFSVLPGLGGGRFADALVFDTGQRFLAVATGDFDEDDLSDLVLAADSGDSVVVAFSNGDDSFDVTSEDVGGPTASVAVGDFNHDDHADLAAQSPGKVVVRLGGGDGDFADPVSYSTGTGYGKVAVGDFDGNGRDDLVTTPGSNTASLAVLTSKPDGTFDAPKLANSTGCCVFGLLVADFNADGRSDAAVNTVSLATTVHLAGADGTLGAGQDFAPTNSHPSPAVGDMDHDGRLDLAVASFNGQISLLRGLGTGGFGAPGVIATAGHFVSALGLDANEDGFADLALGDGATQSVVIALNAPSLAPSPAALDFGTIAVGATSQGQTFTLVNDGLPPLSIRDVALSGTNPGEFRIVADGCRGRTLQADAGCTVTLQATPAAGGARSAVLDVASDAAEGDGHLPIRVSGAALTVAPTVAPIIMPRDSLAPALTTALRRQRLVTVIRQGFGVTIGCSEACRLDVRLFAGKPLARRLRIRAAKPIARATVGLAAGRRTVKLTLSPRVRRALRRLTRARRPLRTARLSLEIVATDAAGNATRVTKSVRLRP